jgi:hypothetical protein
MKKYLWTTALCLLQFTFLAQAQVPPFMCHLSISSPSGVSSLCNAVHIGQGRLLSAAHCFPEGKKTITHGIVLASCGEEEFMDFSNLRKSPDSPKGSLGEDISLLEFSPELKGDWIVPTSYPAMYFAGGQLRTGVECEILALRGPYPSKKLKRIKVDSTMELRALNNRNDEPAQIQMKLKSGGALVAGTNVQEGDSGGALICRYSKNARHELVGIIMNYGTDHVTKKIMQNAFSPVFGAGAKKILLPKG